MQIWLLASRTLGISQHILPQSLIYVRVVHRQLPNYVVLARFVRSSALVWTTPVYFPLFRFTQITIWCYRRPSHVATGGPPNSSFWSVYKPLRHDSWTTPEANNWCKTNGCRMFRPITGSAHGPNKPFSQQVNSEVFSLAWAESIVYATGASGFRGPKQLTYSNWEMGFMKLITFVIFANWTDLWLGCCNRKNGLLGPYYLRYFRLACLHVVTEKCYALN